MTRLTMQFATLLSICLHLNPLATSGRQIFRPERREKIFTYLEIQLHNVETRDKGGRQIRVSYSGAISLYKKEKAIKVDPR